MSMNFYAYVKAGAKHEKIEQIDENHFMIWTKEPAIEDRANIAVAKILAKFLGLAPSQLTLTKGHHYKEKVFTLD